MEEHEEWVTPKCVGLLSDSCGEYVVVDSRSREINIKNLRCMH